jgi:hypothetical protein
MPCHDVLYEADNRHQNNATDAATHDSGYAVTDGAQAEILEQRTADISSNSRRARVEQSVPYSYGTSSYLALLRKAIPRAEYQRSQRTAASLVPAIRKLSQMPNRASSVFSFVRGVGAG